jgi:homoserine dehydrogenase
MSALVQPVPQVRVASSLRTVRVGLAGCGVVGGAFARLLRAQQHHLAARHGVAIDVTTLLVRETGRVRDAIAADVPVTADPARFLAADVDLVVECLGGVDVPYRVAAETLLRGIPFVTANKALIATHGDALQRAADAAGTGLGIEASVAGGAPVIRTVADALQHAGITGVQGVLNGTTNFVLSRVAGGMAFDAAVTEAQRLGFAEADPTRDLSGRDAADKLAILAWLAFGVPPSSLRIECRGIDAGAASLCRVAAALGGTLRLIGQAELTAAGVVAAVEPVIVDAASPFAHVAAEDNLLRIGTRHGGAVSISGPGAGGSATAVSLLADVVRPFRLQPPSGGVSAVEDPRPHNWFVAAAAGSVDALQRYASGRGLTLHRTGHGGVFSIRSETRCRIAALQHSATSAGVTLAVLRHAHAAAT